MKKIFTYALLVLSALCCIIGLSACQETAETPPAEAEKTYGAWTPTGDHRTHYQVCDQDGSTVTEECDYIEVVVAATCEKGGYTALACTACGDVIKQNETDKLGHKYPTAWQSDGNGKHYKVCENDPTHRIEEDCELVTTVIPAKCEEAGYTLHACPDCDYSYTDNVVKALGHDFSQPWEQDVVSKTHKNVCQRQGCDHVEAGACKFETRVVDPTCDDDGYTVFTCSECGYSYQDVPVGKLGHKWGNEYFESEGNAEGHATHYRVCENDPTHHDVTECTFTQSVTDASCDAEGYTTNTCPLCSFSYESNRTDKLQHVYGAWQHVEGKEVHEKTCDLCGDKVEEPCRYSYVTTDPTCVTGGFTLRTCDVCNDEAKTDVKGALDHDYGDPVHDTQLLDGKSTHTYTCKRSGCTAETVGHVKTEVCVMKDVADVPKCTETVDDYQVCEKCSYSEDIGDIAPVGHKWKDVTLSNPEGWVSKLVDGIPKHVRTCSVCSEEEENACNLSVSVTDATCTEGKKETSSCALCGYSKSETLSEPLQHDFAYTPIENTHQHKLTCRRQGCSETRTADCSYNDVVTLPTCLEDGYTTHTCTLCEGTYTSDRKTALGHDWTLKEASTDGRTHTLVCTHDSNHTKSEDCQYDLVNTAATCTSGGYHTHTCRICRNSYQDKETDPLGHSWTYVYNSSDKTHTQTCSVCRTQETHSCEFEKGTPVAPTCQKAGYTVYTCKTCRGTYEGDPVGTTEHKYGGWSHVKAGFTAYNSEHERTCEVCGAKERKQCELQFEVIDPTCTTQGYTKVTCKTCNREATRRNLIAAYGHTYDGWEYTGDGETHTHTQTCIRCQNKITQECTIVSSDQAATCTAAGIHTDICTVCGYTDSEEAGEMLNHALSGYISSNNGKHYRYCTRPNCSFKEEDDCSYDSKVTPESCTEPSKTEKVCSFCEHTVIEYGSAPAGHHFDDPEITETNHKITCTVCGYNEDKPHDFSESNICICGKDGLIYEQPEIDGAKAAYYIVKDNSKVIGAKHIVIPDRIGGIPVEYIKDYLFNRNTVIESVVLPRTLKDIGANAFANCSNLKSVTFSQGEEPCALRKISYCAFILDTKLSVMEFPEGLVMIDDSAFSGCSSLKEIDIPDSVIEIGTSAFYQTGLYNDSASWDNGVLYLNRHLIKVANIPSDGKFRIQEGTLSVSRECFKDRTGLVELYIPDSLIVFDKDAFSGCNNLYSVEFEGTVAQWLKIFFENDLASPMHFASTLHIDGAKPNGENGLLDLSAADSVTAIPAGTFRGITGIKKVIIPANITSIGSNAFNGCSDLEEIVLKGSLTQIGDNVFDGTAFYLKDGNWEDGVLYLTDELGKHYLLDAKDEKLPEDGKITVKSGTLIICATAFKDCTRLTEVTIPETVNYIGAKAFKGCTALTKVIFEGDVTFFAFNEGGAGRSYSTKDDLLRDATWAANSLKGYLSGYWTKSLRLG